MDEQKTRQDQETSGPGETAPPEPPTSERSSADPPATAKLQHDNETLRKENAALRSALAQAKAGHGSGKQEETPAREEFRYRMLFDNANDAVFVYHLAPEGTPSRFAEVNRIACERYGYAREELLRMMPADLVDPAVNVADKLQELRQKGQFVTDSVHRTKDGRRIATEVSAHLFEISGQPTVLSICRDITARRKTEKQLRRQKEALQHSLARRKAMLASALDCIITMDDQGRIAEFNAAAEETFGYKREEVIGRLLSEVIVPPRLREAHTRGMERFLQAGQSEILGRRTEMPALHASGRELPVELAITCTWLEEDRPFFTGYLRDITERKRAEQERADLLERERAARTEAEASEERVAFLAKASIVLASSLDYEVTLQRVAELAVPRLADWCVVTMLVPEAATDEAPGEAFQQVAIAHVDPEKVAWAHELRERFAPDPEASHGASHVIRTGEPKFYPEIQEELLAAVARNDEHLDLLRKVGFRSAIIVPMKVRGDVIGAITLARSDTEEHYAEPDLRLAEELARRAALEINNAEIYRKLQTLYTDAQEARREAEEMNRLKSAFLANMSHEIRTPLTGILGFADMLAKRLAAQEQEFARRIRTGGQRLMDTLDAVLALSRLEAGESALELRPLRLTEEARQALGLLEKQAQQKGLALTFSVAPGAEEASALLDRGALSSIVQNLVGNAIKFTSEGKITVTIEEDAGEVYLHVEDTGSGIDEAFLPHLFEPFQQESKGWARSHEGTGLGLALTKQLIEVMGGRMDIQSEKGVGSRFTAAFPAAPAIEEEECVPGDAPKTRPEPRQTPPQLLLVEDNEDTQLLMQTLLGEMSEVKVASSTEGALKEVRKRIETGGEAEEHDRPRSFDVCLVDINLGRGKSGTDLLKELRALPDYQETPIVAITGYALPGDRERLLEIGFDAYLAKPFDPEALLELASRLLSR